MTNHDIEGKLRRIERNRVIQNLIAQANARYILFNTSEDKQNFPLYTIKDEDLNVLAFYYLNYGCALAENQRLHDAKRYIEKGAAIIEFVHASENNRITISSYYGLIASMAYYVCFQYSKSFILVKKFKTSTLISKLVSLFLERKYPELMQEIDALVLKDEYTDEILAEEDDFNIADSKIYEITIARSLNSLVNYLFSGDERLLEYAKTILFQLKEIAEAKSDPGIWWVIRLLLLITDGLTTASLWKSLGTKFDIENEKVITYINSLTYQPSGIFELFITQRNSLTTVLDHTCKGSIVSIPTSSGKTRIAEIAILDLLIKEPEGKVLYIAPFRSLAFEIENSLEQIFGNMQINVSQLYGGSLLSKLDQKVIEESHVIIATPEKSKAILRGNSDILNQIKLVIIDEGHLLGPDKRLIITEAFYEELRFFVKKNEGRFLLLSAVLPNPQDIAEWLTGSSDTVYSENWRPSDERMGILEWTGTGVNLKWESNDQERKSFNNKFIVREELPLKPKQRKLRYWPMNLNESVAAAAYKLHTLGPVLIYVGRKDSVFVMAECFLKALGDNSNNFEWKSENDWKAFELACTETYGDGEENKWLSYARKGILCHNSNLHADVRIPLEKLMRNDKPKTIISTSTLGQGVNLGVSTVIFATLFENQKYIEKRDFWNIAGRAGRAFVDFEGKTLVALDASNTSEEGINRKNWMERKIKGYFDKEGITHATSGIFQILLSLKKLADENDIDFDYLIQLIAENKLEELPKAVILQEEKIKGIDDSLLSLHDLNTNEGEEEDYSWVESYFRESLAFIQATRSSVVSGESVLTFIRGRLENVVSRVGTDRNKWRSIITSGMPINSSLVIDNKLDQIIDFINEYYLSEANLSDKIALLKNIEELINEVEILEKNAEYISYPGIDEIRKAWLTSVSICEMQSHNNLSEKVITSIYTYLLPWLLNGIAKKLHAQDLEAEAELIEELAVLVEFGLPDMKTVKIYQAGIRSRVAANEIAQLFDDEIWERSVRYYKIDMVINRKNYSLQVSQQAQDWLSLLERSVRKKSKIIDQIPNFSYGDVHKTTSTLLAKRINDEQYLVSDDLTFIEKVEESNIDFNSVSNVPGVYFKYSEKLGEWQMKVDNPYLKIREE